MISHRRLLKNLDTFLESRAKKATDSPVFLKVGNFRDKTEVARLVKYEPNTRGKTKGLQTEYEIVFSRRELNECREKNPNCERDMKQVMAHELAHINHPSKPPRWVHGPGWQRECHRLGGGDRCVARGIERNRRGCNR